MDDIKSFAAVITSIVAITVSGFSFYLNLWRTRKEIETKERKLLEDLEIELVKQRIENTGSPLFSGSRLLQTAFAFQFA